MIFAGKLFSIAGGLGLLAIVPLYFLEQRIGRELPPAINHPEFFYGLLGVTTWWHVALLVIGGDPARYRPLMVPANLEKATFGFAAIPLYASGRVHSPDPGPWPR